jgi:hypothetical protein
VISIGGAVPSANHFSLAATRINLPGFVRAGFPTTLSVFLADRFTNFNVLAGTQVSFIAEAGAVDTSVSLDETGTGTVTLRTQQPMPLSPMPAGHPFPMNGRGWLTVVALTRGEEAFADVNANGVYDAGVDTFNATMDLGEPFVDSNENGVWDGPGCTQAGCDTTHVGERYVDANGNGRYDVANGVWDGPGCVQAGCLQSPMIWTSMLLQFTGHIAPVAGSCAISPTTFNLASGESQSFTVTLHDQNLNAPVPGTTISVSSDSGTLLNANVTVLDGISSGPYQHTFTLARGIGIAARTTTLTITVLTPAGESVVTCVPFQISGQFL